MNNIKNTCEAILSLNSIISHQNLTLDEKSCARNNMNDLLTAADRLGISCTVQNALLYIGETYDIRINYLSTLMVKAFDRAGTRPY